MRITIEVRDSEVAELTDSLAAGLESLKIDGFPVVEPGAAHQGPAVAYRFFSHLTVPGGGAGVFCAAGGGHAPLLHQRPASSGVSVLSASAWISPPIRSPSVA